MSIKPAVNVWTSFSTEAHLDRLAKQARDIEETCAKSLRLKDELLKKAQNGDRAAERALAILVDGTYEGFAEAMLESRS